MNGLLAMLFVVLIIVLGLGASWAITANGAATGPSTDTFGNTPPASTIEQDNASASLAVALMPIGTFAFIIAVCVVLVIAIVWLWKSGHNTKGKY
ncbi:MAG: hypothetical protein M0Q91_05485 [Methanoregula sp.]|jgi:uncharacterized membrane protein|nr:hypothetical protein [Methanoregula sp.]